MGEEYYWDEKAVAKLRKLWASGLSAAKIGLEIGTTKNAICGKVKRLRLTPRASPISAAPRNSDVPRKRPSPRVSSENARIVTAFFENPGVVIAEKPVVVAVAARMPGAFKPCAFPIGDPKAPGFQFCNGAALVNRPYCEEHAAICYVYVRDRREAAA